MFNRIILAFGVALSLAGVLAASPELAATLLKASGKGRVVLPGGGTGEYKAGTMLKPGSRVVTEEDSMAVLLLEDGSRVNLGPNTDLTVAELASDGDKHTTVFELLRGLFKASVQKLTVGSRFEVKTSNAVAAVKGTEFEVEVDEKGTDARVLEGTVWLDDAAHGIHEVVGAHKACRALSEGRAEALRDLTPKEVDNFKRWARESWQGSHSGAYLPADQERQARWQALRPEQRAKVGKDLADSMGGQFWDDVLSLSAEERQERWRDRLRDTDERRLAAEDAKVDFALGKSVIDRQGRRVRFDEYVLRPAANQVQFLNYSRRDNRVDTLSAINTYNKNLPDNLSEASGLNQRLWLQGYATPPQYWVVDSALVAGNSNNDALAMNTSFFDPYYRAVAGFWELPVRDVDIRLNIPDLNQPRVGGIQVEHWVRQYTTPSDAPNSYQPAPALTPIAGVGHTYDLTVALRSAPGSTNNIVSDGSNASASPAAGGTNINNTNLVWGLGVASTMPTTTLLDAAGLEAKPGDLAFGFRRTYFGGQTLEFRNYIIDENGQVVNIAGIPPDQLMDAMVKKDFVASLYQIELRSNQFQSDDGINIVSKMLFLHDLTKTQDQL